MKILIMSYYFYPSIGGTELIAELLAKYFVSCAHSVRIVTQTELGADKSDSNHGLTVLREPSPLALISSYIWADAILQVTLEVRPLWPLLFVRKPLIVGLQTWIKTDSGKQSFTYYLKMLALRYAKHVVACSSAIKRATFKNAVIIGNPYNDNTFCLYPEVDRSTSIVFVGRLVKEKGTDLLLRAYANSRISNCPLTIIGSGPELQQLRHLAEVLGISAFVSFLGPLSGRSLALELNRHEVMVVPSIWDEPFGIVALEGMACGCIVLSSDSGGLPDAVGNSALFFKRSDVNDLANKLSLLFEDHELRVQLRSGAKKHLQSFHADVVARQYLQLLLESARN